MISQKLICIVMLHVVPHVYLVCWQRTWTQLCLIRLVLSELLSELFESARQRFAGTLSWMLRFPGVGIIPANFPWNDLYAAGICTDEMPFKSILYSSSEPSVFLHWTIALWIACLKCLYCCPQPLLAVTKRLSLSAHTHSRYVQVWMLSVYFIQWPYWEW